MGRFKHGGGNTRRYKQWGHMKSRCLNSLDKAYHRYGGRGIKICTRWLDENRGFLNFVEDMGECPEGYELDRIDNNGNYEPENCRWASHMEQCRNRRPNILCQYLG